MSAPNWTKLFGPSSIMATSQAVLLLLLVASLIGPKIGSALTLVSEDRNGVLATPTTTNKPVIKSDIQAASSQSTGAMTAKAHTKRHSGGHSEDFAPKLLHQPQSVLIKPNEPHTIECAIESQPEAEVKWFKDDQLLASRSSKSTQMDKELTFYQVSDEDTGDYHCQATNYLGTVTSDHFRLTVQSSVHEPRIRFEPKVAEVAADQQVEFTCTIPAAQANNKGPQRAHNPAKKVTRHQSPAPEVSWRRNGRRLLVEWLEVGEEPAEASSRFAARRATNGDYVLTITRTQIKDDNATFTCLYRQQNSAGDNDDSPLEASADSELARESSPVKLRVYDHWIPAQQPPLDNHVKLDVDLAPPIDNLELDGNQMNELQRQHHLQNNHTTQLQEPRRVSSLRETLLDLYEIVKPALVIIGLVSLVGMFVVLQLVIIKRRNRQNRYMKHHQYSSAGSGSSGASSAIGAGSIDCDPVLNSLMARTLSAPNATSLSGAGKKFKSYRDHMRKVAAAGDLVASDLVDSGQHFACHQQQQQQQQALQFGIPQQHSITGGDQDPFFSTALGQANLYNQTRAAREQARSLLQASYMRSLSNLNSCHKQQQQQCMGQDQGLRLSQNGSHLNLPLSFAFGGAVNNNDSRQPNTLIEGPSQLMANALWQPHLAHQTGASNRGQQQKQPHSTAHHQQLQHHKNSQQDEHYQLVNCSSISPSSTSSMVGGSSNSSGQQRQNSDFDQLDHNHCQQHLVGPKDSQNHYSIIETNDEEARYEEVDQQGANSRRCNLHPDSTSSAHRPSDSFGALRTSTFVIDHNNNTNNRQQTPSNHSSQNSNNTNQEGLNHKSSLRSSLISNTSTSGYGESSTNTSGSLVSDAFSRFGSKRSSGQHEKQQAHNKSNSGNTSSRLSDKQRQKQQQQGYQDQLSPYAVSSICGSIPPPPVNSEAMRALNEQFDINHLMMLDESASNQTLPFNAPPPPPLPQPDEPTPVINNNDVNHGIQHQAEERENR